MAYAGNGMNPLRCSWSLNPARNAQNPTPSLTLQQVGQVRYQAKQRSGNCVVVA